MDTTEPFDYFNSFEIEMAPQPEAINACDARITQLRQRLMQFGKVMTNLDELEKEMQHKQQIRAQHALSQQIISLNQSIKNEKLKINQLKKEANDFLINKCKKDFIPRTLDLHKLLSQQYVESQYDVINKYKIEINDIKQSIHNNPSQILRLFYILFSIEDILYKIKHNQTDENAPNLIDGDDEEKNDVVIETPQSKLKDTQSQLVAYIAKILPSIKAKYLNELSKLLKYVSWPKIGEHKSIDKSSPQKWADIELICCDLFGIEYYVQYMCENKIFMDITESVSETSIYKSWVIDTFLEPVIKRFEYNFNGNNKTNRLNKPEYFLNFILQIIEDNLGFIKQVLQPLVLENGLDLNIEMVFIYGLMDVVKIKCRNNIKILANLLTETLKCQETYSKRGELYERGANVTKTAMQGMKVVTEMSAQSLQSLVSTFKMFKEEKNNDNEMGIEQKYNGEEDEKKVLELKQKEIEKDRQLKEKRIANEKRLINTKLLISHIINEMITFQSKLNGLYPWIKNDLNVNVMNEIVCVEIMRTEWIEMEKERINKNSLLINTQSDIEIFEILHRDFITKFDNYYMTRAVYDILTILESIEERIGTIVDIKYKYIFVKELIIQLLNLCTDYIKEQFPTHIHFKMCMSKEEVTVCCGIINSTDYLCEFLKKWSYKTVFEALSYYEQINDSDNENEIEIIMQNVDDIVTEKWLINQAKILKLHVENNEFFNEFIKQNEGLQEKHIIGLSAVICHEFVLDCSQYLLETFGYITYVEQEQKEEDNGMGLLSIHSEFEDGYYKLCDLLYACYKSLPWRLFENVRTELSKTIDDELFGKILNIKVSFFYSASQQLKYDLEHMFALFYVDEFFLIPNYQKMDSNMLDVDGNMVNKFPKLTGLLTILTMKKVKLNEFVDELGIKSLQNNTGNKPNVNNNELKIDDDIVGYSISEIDREMTFEKTKQVLHRYSVDTLTVEKIGKIINKMSSMTKSQSYDVEENNDDDDDWSSFSDL